MTLHGGDVWRVGEEFGIPVSELIDFSANINPLGLPAGARASLARDASNSKLLSFYPDPSAHRLRCALSKHLECPLEAIVVGAGAESLLSPILRSLEARRALTPIPAFSEYRRVCSQLGVEFVPFPLLRSESFRTPVERFGDSIEAGKCDLALLNNPHNPSGSMLDAIEMRSILDTAVSCRVAVVLDEAFIDYAPHESLVREAASRPGLVVVRSLTKFYGCPALRVGYAVAHPVTAQRIQSLLPTWAVTQMAMDTMSEAIADQDYAKATLCGNAIEREWLCDSLRGLGLTVFPSAANYLFAELTANMPTASQLRSRLISRHRILIRNCDSYEGLVPGRYVRFAVRSRTDNELLVQSLSQELKMT